MLSSNGQPGSEVIVGVELNGMGDETAMSFTIRFDPKILEFRGVGGTDNEPDVMAGKGSPAGMVRTLNAAAADKGRLGLLLQSSTVFGVGRREILNLRFYVRDDARRGVAMLAFGDETLARSTTNALARLLDAEWLNGTVVVGKKRGERIAWMAYEDGGRLRWPAWPGGWSPSLY
jgi:hypothetical protein